MPPPHDDAYCIGVRDELGCIFVSTTYNEVNVEKVIQSVVIYDLFQPKTDLFSTRALI